MPELPEVETVKNVLKEHLINRKIIKVDIKYSNIIKTNIKDFYNIINQEIINIDRKGKWLIFELTNYYLVSHLRMEGKYFIKEQSDNILKHEHIIFYLDNDLSLRYHDTRKFGCMYLVNKDKLYIDTPLSKIGLEPFDSNLTVSYLENKFKNIKLPIKTTLLNQEIIAGIGNIYDDEILFLCKINPLTKTNSLTKDNLDDIIKYSRIVLLDAIKNGGSTIKSYTSSLGVIGNYQDKLLVHTKNICPNCNSKILKIKVGGRGTYYCPNCQGDSL